MEKKLCNAFCLNATEEKLDLIKIYGEPKFYSQCLIIADRHTRIKRGDVIHYRANKFFQDYKVLNTQKDTGCGICAEVEPMWDETHDIISGGWYWHKNQNKIDRLTSIREADCNHTGKGIVNLEILPDIIPVEQDDVIITSNNQVFQVSPSLTCELVDYTEDDEPIARYMGVLWEKTTDGKKIVNTKPLSK